MKRIGFPLILFMVLLISACGGSPEQTYSSNGIQFTKPAGWKIDDAESEPEEGILFIEKEGLTASGIVSILWYAVEVGGDVLLETYMAELEGMEEMTDFNASKTEPMTHGNFQAEGCRFWFKSMGIPHSGTSYAFSCGDYIVLTAYQGADEDKAKNAEGFRLIEATLTCD